MLNFKVRSLRNGGLNACHRVAKASRLRLVYLNAMLEALFTTLPITLHMYYSFIDAEFKSPELE